MQRKAFVARPPCQTAPVPQIVINGAEQKACAFRPKGRGTGLLSDLGEMLAG